MCTTNYFTRQSPLCDCNLLSSIAMRVGEKVMKSSIIQFTHF